MEIFSALLALYEGNPPVTGGFPSQRPVTRSFGVFSAPEQNGWVRIIHVLKEGVSFLSWIDIMNSRYNGVRYKTALYAAR